MHDTIVRLADVWKTCNKIRAAAFRVGLNLWDWYRPLDPEGNSLISESKFVSVLAGPLRAVVGLSDAEIAQVADYFRAQDGRVLYHQLCQIIHGEDAGARDKTSADCVLEACPPPPEPPCRRLDQWQARRLCCLLATVAQRDLPLRPYFQDYELVAKNDGRITFAHFARILDYIGVIVSPEDFNLLVRRYIKDSYTLDYVAFLKEIEAVKKEGIQGLGPEYKHPKAVIDTTPPKPPPTRARPTSCKYSPRSRGRWCARASVRTSSCSSSTRRGRASSRAATSTAGWPPPRCRSRRKRWTPSWKCSARRGGGARWSTSGSARRWARR